MQPRRSSIKDSQGTPVNHSVSQDPSLSNKGPSVSQDPSLSNNDPSVSQDPSLSNKDPSVSQDPSSSNLDSSISIQAPTANGKDSLSSINRPLDTMSGLQLNIPMVHPLTKLQDFLEVNTQG
jgi:hypothetical protein